VSDSARRDYEFHEAIVELSGNRTTLAAYRMLRPVIEEIMHVGKTNRPAQQRAFEAHAELVAALRARDRVAYTYLMSRHLEFGLQFVEQGPQTSAEN
jgi:DNA-binding FadR family transcriptional regulator